MTLPGRRHPVGRQHVIGQIMDEIVDIFSGLGYQVAEGPEVELDYYNFTALNHPPDHPARALQDTFYVKDLSGDRAVVEGESDVLLRTHTSPTQVHIMESQKPPIYVLAPGKVYRRDVADPSHLPQFTQVEGLVVDEGITLGDLKGTLEHFVHQMFGPDRRVRLRPHFFPFTEPSAEVDVSCGICGGAGCRTCSGEGWLEILGCGMVDPERFRLCGHRSGAVHGFRVRHGCRARSPCSSTACRTCACSSKATRASSISSSGPDPLRLPAGFVQEGHAMRVSLTWLKDLVDITLPVEELCDRLDMTGTKVEAVHRLGAALEGVVVGQVHHERPAPRCRQALRTARWTSAGPSRSTSCAGRPTSRPATRCRWHAWGRPSPTA